MTDLKVLQFPKKPKEEDELFVEFPDAEKLDYLLGGKKMTGLMMIVRNEDGKLSFLGRNLMNYEAIGMLEAVKGLLVEATYLDEEEDDE